MDTSKSIGDIFVKRLSSITSLMANSLILTLSTYGPTNWNMTKCSTNSKSKLENSLTTTISPSLLRRSMVKLQSWNLNRAIKPSFDWLHPKILINTYHNIYLSIHLFIVKESWIFLVKLLLSLVYLSKKLDTLHQYLFSFDGCLNQLISQAKYIVSYDELEPKMFVIEIYHYFQQLFFKDIYMVCKCF